MLALPGRLPVPYGMDGYGQFCPVAKAAEVLTKRWTPLVVRELLADSHRFNDLHRGVPRMSRSLLSKRLDELERAGVVERRLVGPDEHPEYHLTEAGRELRPIIEDLGRWGQRWIRSEVSSEDLDAGLLMWDVRRRVPEDAIPDQRRVVHFHFPDEPSGQRDYWLVLEGSSADLCLKPPGYPADLEVTADTAALTGAWVGDFDLARALNDGTVRIEGPPALRRALPRWLGLSVFAGVPRPG